MQYFVQRYDGSPTLRNDTEILATLYRLDDQEASYLFDESEGTPLLTTVTQQAVVNTALQMVAILLLILHHPYVIDFGFMQIQADLNQVGLSLLYVSLAFALTSGGEYMKLFVDAVDAKEQRLADEE